MDVCKRLLSFDFELRKRFKVDKTKITNEIFNREVKALKEVKCKYSVEMYDNFNDDKFYYATIITIYKKNVFEYACLNDEKNEIAYIYIQNVKYNEVCFEKKYLPVEFRYYYNELMVTKDEYNYYH